MTDKSDRDIIPHLLLVEDNAAYILLLEEAVSFSGIALELQAVHNGEEAMDYLHRNPPFESVTRPDLILLDLNLPKKNGFEVLAEIRQDEELHRIPVIILSTSEASEDINRCYRLGANCYISKLGDFERFIETMQGIASFWLGAD